MATLRNLSRRCQGEVLRALTFALKHNATITIRCAAARKVSADSWRRANATPLQRRVDREPRARGAGHTDGCNWPFCRTATAMGGAEHGRAIPLADIRVLGYPGPQSPVPGFGDNKLALSGLSSHSFASGGGSRFTVMFGQTRAYSALMPSHFSSPASVSGLIASTGHSGSQARQSMHSSGWMTSMFSPS